MKIPGEILKKYIRFGSPAVNGQYLCWVKPDQTPKMSFVPISPIKIKEYRDGNWISIEHVIAWIGPLPVYSLDELFNEGDSADLIAYGIGTEEGAKKDQFKQGPFNESIQTQFTFGEPGDYVFELHPNQPPKIIKMWSETAEKWVKFDETKKKDTKVHLKKKTKFKRLKKKTGKESFWWVSGTKKEAAQGFKNKTKEQIPMINVPGTKKGDIIWNCSLYWKIPFPEFIWNGKEWKKPNMGQVEKIQNIVKRLMSKYETKKQKK